MVRKKSLRLTAVALALICAFCVMSIPTKAAYYRNWTTRKFDCMVGQCAEIVFHSEGVSNKGSGYVTNMYFTHWANWPNQFQDLKTWKSYYPIGQKANGQYTLKSGVITKWLTLNMGSQTGYMFHTYGH